ncbi:MAG TPA: hypothetical protein RMH99_18995, partial [Sandaracinaceae bacterium LLY-WYZ-13_1]|nr:hypothetical protein [Sandaracinaceae bacterium LLY-WYZ-13_1]
WVGATELAPTLGLEGDEVEALVLDERHEEDRVILTLQAQDETLLASFRERRDDVASLVAPGDTVVMLVSERGPFTDDAPILSVRRGEGPRESADRGDDAPQDAADDGAATGGDGPDPDGAASDPPSDPDDPDEEATGEDPTDDGDDAPTEDAVSARDGDGPASDEA